jgi:hypothetical protein
MVMVGYYMVDREVVGTDPYSLVVVGDRMVEAGTGSDSYRIEDQCTVVVETGLNSSLLASLLMHYHKAIAANARP